MGAVWSINPNSNTTFGGENKFVNITDSNGCEKEFAVFVPKVSSVEITSVNTFDNLFSGSVSGQIDVTVAGIASPFNYSLSGIGIFFRQIQLYHLKT